MEVSNRRSNMRETRTKAEKAMEARMNHQRQNGRASASESSGGDGTVQRTKYGMGMLMRGSLHRWFHRESCCGMDQQKVGIPGRHSE